MTKHPAGVLLAPALDPASRTPLHRQLYEGLREAILSGRVRAGTRFPATRALAADLAISRTTVLTAFAQLLAEGYLEARVGSGTWVAGTLPDDLLKARARPRAPLPATRVRVRLSRRSRMESWLGAATSGGVARPLRPGIPALDGATLEAWARLASKHWRRASRSMLEYGDPTGYRPLREAIAGYLGIARAVRCTGDQVIVVGGSQQALYLCAQMLLDPGDPAWIEEPGYPGAHAALRSAGARLVPVPVDGQGLVIAAKAARGRTPRLIYVTPSHQCPIGVTMTVSRRLELLQWAGRAGAWILEDDYDSEFRYSSRPLASLQSLDTERRVIYVGSFSKSLFPSLRIGFVVAPAPLVEPFRRGRAAMDRQSPTLDQVVLAEFMTEGHFERHLRRMRALYSERRQVLIEAAKRELHGILDLASSDAGIHTVGWLGPGVDDRLSADAARAHGVEVLPLSAFCLEPPWRGGLVLGYGAYDGAEIRAGVKGLARALSGV
jgi:GntR family transcriptional regulator/MocR family aminotransferase